MHRSLELIAGVDEAGRGPLAGPVCAAAVIIATGEAPAGVTDSKLLSHEKRLELARAIEISALAYAVAFASVEEIDRLNILHASLLAMRRAVEALSVAPASVLVDGNHCPSGLACPSQAVVRGDQLVCSISAASILAKVARDREMERLDGLYPGYGFGQHRGYSTEAHLYALDRLGPCREHRRSFAPVKLRLARMLSG